MKIPIFIKGWTSINPSYFDVNYRGTIGFDTLPYIHGQFKQLNRGEKDLEDLNEIDFFSASYVHSTHGPRAVEIPGPSVPREISCGSPCLWHPSKSLSFREPNFEQFRSFYNIFMLEYHLPCIDCIDINDFFMLKNPTIFQDHFLFPGSCPRSIVPSPGDPGVTPGDPRWPQPPKKTLRPAALPRGAGGSGAGHAAECGTLWCLGSRGEVGLQVETEKGNWKRKMGRAHCSAVEIWKFILMFILFIFDSVRVYMYRDTCYDMNRWKPSSAGRPNLIHLAFIAVQTVLSGAWWWSLAKTQTFDPSVLKTGPSPKCWTGPILTGQSSRYFTSKTVG